MSNIIIKYLIERFFNLLFTISSSEDLENIQIDLQYFSYELRVLCIMFDLRNNPFIIADSRYSTVYNNNEEHNTKDIFYTYKHKASFYNCKWQSKYHLKRSILKFNEHFLEKISRNKKKVN